MPLSGSEKILFVSLLVIWVSQPKKVSFNVPTNAVLLFDQCFKAVICVINMGRGGKLDVLLSVRNLLVIHVFNINFLLKCYFLICY